MSPGAKKPQVERELKFAGVDLDLLRSRLIELEAERLGPPSDEDNWLLDRNGELRAMAAKRLKSSSSGPKTSDGRKITASGNALRTASSPAALLRA